MLDKLIEDAVGKMEVKFHARLDGIEKKIDKLDRDLDEIKTILKGST